MTDCGEKLSKKKTKRSQHTQPGQIFVVQSCRKDYFFSFHRCSFFCVLGKLVKVIHVPNQASCALEMQSVRRLVAFSLNLALYLF